MRLDKMSLDEASVLQVAAVLVAAPRYAGAIAYALGVNVAMRYAWFIDAEVGSAVALAVLEGWAIAYVVRAIRLLPTNSVHGKRLSVMVGLLLLMLPIIGTPYMVGAGEGAGASFMMPMWAVWAWKFVVNAVVPLFVAAVGYASGTQKRTPTPSTKTHSDTARPVRPVQLAHVSTPSAHSGLTERQQTVVRQLESGTTMVAQIAQQIGVHRNTITNDLRTLAAQGIVRKNGHGWKVVREDNHA